MDVKILSEGFLHRVAAILMVLIIPMETVSLEAGMGKMNQEIKTELQKSQADKIAVIPAPMRLEKKEGSFCLDSKTKIFADKAVMNEARYLTEVLAPAFGVELTVEEFSPGMKAENAILLNQDVSLKDLGDEGYRLEVEKDRIRVLAGKAAGIFYACQTIRQLLPVEIFSSSRVSGVTWSIPCVSIEDKPRYEWRGELFDCCRHFFPKETVKRAIDLLALHKMNRLHWHLTEDQGWRLEIKKYPKLTEVGAWRIGNDKSRYGGFYTQDDVREIVAYAASRHIIVVPEIEMPGHSSAALASYPELGCTGGPYQVANSWGVFPDVYCAGNDRTFEIIQDVLDEVMTLFPSAYIHIGGDECPKERWKNCPKCQARIRNENLKDENELQSYFIKRIDRYLTQKGRRLIGWDEILEGGLAPNAIVQSWRGVKGGIEAANQNHDVIMSPTSHCYLDYAYAAISLEKSYSFEPVPEGLAPEKASLIKGLEGNIWTEHVPDQDRLDFQVYPRLSALAEVAWSPRETRSWKDFESRMLTHNKRFEKLGVKYGFDELENYIKDSVVIGNWKAEQMKKEGVELNWDLSPFVKDPGTYHAIFFYTKGTAAIEIAWAAILEDGKEIQRDAHTGWSGGNKRDIVYKFVLSRINPKASYTLKAHLTPHGDTTDSNGEVRFKKEIPE